MNDMTEFTDRLLDLMVELLDVPASHYKLATKRYESLGEWFHRDESQVAKLDPAVSAQGSFRLGTVIRPLLKEDEYDLDLVCRLVHSKDLITQKQLKRLIGDEVKAYATAHSMNEPPIERKRCWRIEYADGVSFHIDIVPAIPDDEVAKRVLAQMSVAGDYTAYALVITDNTHPGYDRIADDWPRSNPEGFARWFDLCMRQGPMVRARTLVREGVYASVDEVPAYERKSILQRAVQLLKRHRDVMFKDDCEVKPISVIITALAARAYSGQASLYEALKDIIAAMPGLIGDRHPRIPNPVNPAEDFADKWAKNPDLEPNFWAWHKQVQNDLQRLAEPMGVEARRRTVDVRFALTVSAEELHAIGGAEAGDTVVSSPPYVHIASAPKPWGHSA